MHKSLLHGQFLQNLPHTIPSLLPLLTQAALQLIHYLARLISELIDALSAILETANALHVADSILLDLLVGGFLLQDVDEDEVGGVGPDGVDDREGEFALGQVFAETLGGGVGGGEVEVVVEDLEKEADGIDEGDAVATELYC